MVVPPASGSRNPEPPTVPPRPSFHRTTAFATSCGSRITMNERSDALARQSVAGVAGHGERTSVVDVVDVDAIVLVLADVVLVMAMVDVVVVVEG
jgi:hypothetical protein